MTSFFDRLKSGKNPFSDRKAKERSATTVRTNRFDEQVWKTVRPTEKVEEMVYDLTIGDEHHGGTRAGFDGSPELVHDLFFTFYKAAAEVRGKREVKKESYPVRALIEQIMQNPRLEELQPITAGDTVLSTVAVQSMMETVREFLAQVPPPPQPGGDDWCPCYQEQASHDLATCECPCHEGGGSGGGEGGEPAPKTEKRDPNGNTEGGESEGVGGGGQNEFDPDAEDAEGQSESDWQSMFDDLLDDLDLDRLANKALQNAEADVNELDEIRRGFDFSEGEWLTMSPEQRFGIIERLRNPRFKALADIVGRMKRFALGIRATRVIDVPHEAYDVEMGSDIRRVLKSEFALLADPAAQYEFYRRYATNELMQYKMRGSEDVGRGPIQTVIDKSGSMGGAPMDWAMAVAEALRRFAADEDRDYHAIFFGNNNDRERFDFPGGKGDFEKVMAFLSVAANGGTQFDGVLTEALERAEKCFTGESKGKADIVFITDGQSYLDDEWIEDFNRRRKEIGVRIYSVYIGGAYDMTYQNGPVSLLERISDIVIPVADLRPEAVTDIFARV